MADGSTEKTAGTADGSTPKIAGMADGSLDLRKITKKTGYNHGTTAPGMADGSTKKTARMADGSTKKAARMADGQGKPQCFQPSTKASGKVTNHAQAQSHP